MTTEAKRKPLFATLHAYGMSYLDVQQMRMSAEGRLRQTVEHILIERGAARKARKEDDYGRVQETVEILDQDMEASVTEEVMNDPMYEALRAHRARLQREEKEIITKALEAIGDHPIWDFCKRTRGLSEVAAMTFASTFDPAMILSAGNAHHYLGLFNSSIPEGKLLHTPARKVKGKKANWNTHLKARIWLAATGTIMAKDPYYSEIYRIQKDYYRSRPDLVQKRGNLIISFARESEDKTEEENRQSCGHRMNLGMVDKPKLDNDKLFQCPTCGDLRRVASMKYDGEKGWDGHINNMAVRWLKELLTSHAAEIIVKEEGRTLPKHHNYLPPRPAAEDIGEYLEMFRASRQKLLAEMHELRERPDYQEWMYPPRYLTVRGRPNERAELEQPAPIATALSDEEASKPE